MPDPRIHYAGALRIPKGGRVTVILPGWAACCSGAKAVSIRKSGHNTRDASAVTCKACLSRMAAAGLSVEALDGQ